MIISINLSTELLTGGASWALSCCCFTESISSTLSAVWVVRTPCTWNEQGINGFFCVDESEPVTIDGIDIGVIMRSSDSTVHAALIEDNFSILLMDDEERQLLSVRISSVRRR